MLYLLYPTIFLTSALGLTFEQNRLFATKSEALQACPSPLCDASELASNLPGWYCPQFQATNPATHQHVFCNWGTWIRSTAAPSDCNFANKYQCQAAWNNCWNTPSNQCDQDCTCYNSATQNRLGASLSYAATSTDQLELGASPSLGHGSQCPGVWLPQSHGQLSPGALGVTCYQKGQLCRYPSYGMNFVCTYGYGQGGFWKLQGASPVPSPPSPSPAPSNQCPGYWTMKWNIWLGQNQCNTNGQMCRYPSNGVNYICNRGQWQQVGGPTPAPPTPYPTPAPVNAVTCPPQAHRPQSGDYCTNQGQRCSYGASTFECDNTGVWRSILY